MQQGSSPADPGFQNWQFSREFLNEGTPSRKDKFSLKKESSWRRLALAFGHDVGYLLKMNQYTIATAFVYWQRFFTVQSLAKNDPYLIAAACLLLAGKVEENFKSLQKITETAYFVRNKKDPKASEALRANQRLLLAEMDRVVKAEEVLLMTINFEFSVSHPYRPLLLMVKELGFNKPSTPDSNNAKFCQIAWNFANDSFRTTICLQPVTPTQLAATCLNLAATTLQMKIPPTPEGKPWYTKWDVKSEILHDLELQVMSLYKRKDGDSKTSPTSRISLPATPSIAPASSEPKATGTPSPTSRAEVSKPQQTQHVEKGGGCQAKSASSQGPAAVSKAPSISASVPAPAPEAGPSAPPSELQCSSKPSGQTPTHTTEESAQEAEKPALATAPPAPGASRASSGRDAGEGGQVPGSGISGGKEVEGGRAGNGRTSQNVGSEDMEMDMDMDVSDDEAHSKGKVQSQGQLQVEEHTQAQVRIEVAHVVEVEVQVPPQISSSAQVSALAQVSASAQVSALAQVSASAQVSTSAQVSALAQAQVPTLSNHEEVAGPAIPGADTVEAPSGTDLGLEKISLAPDVEGKVIDAAEATLTESKATLSRQQDTEPVSGKEVTEEEGPAKEPESILDIDEELMNELEDVEVGSKRDKEKKREERKEKKKEWSDADADTASKVKAKKSEGSTNLEERAQAAEMETESKGEKNGSGKSEIRSAERADRTDGRSEESTPRKSDGDRRQRHRSSLDTRTDDGRDVGRKHESDRSEDGSGGKDRRRRSKEESAEWSGRDKDRDRERERERERERKRRHDEGREEGDEDRKRHHHHPSEVDLDSPRRKKERGSDGPSKWRGDGRKEDEAGSRSANGHWKGREDGDRGFHEGSRREPDSRYESDRPRKRDRDASRQDVDESEDSDREGRDGKWRSGDSRGSKGRAGRSGELEKAGGRGAHKEWEEHARKGSGRSGGGQSRESLWDKPRT